MAYRKLVHKYKLEEIYYESPRKFRCFICLKDKECHRYKTYICTYENIPLLYGNEWICPECAFVEGI